MAKQENKTETATAKLAIGQTDEDGFTVVGSWDLDGWYKPEVGRTLEGVVKDAKVGEDEDTGRPTLTYVIQLTKACIGKPIGEDGQEEFAPGDVLGLGESFALRAIRDAVNAQSDVMVRCTPLEKVKLSGRRSMWKWDIRIKPGKPRKVPLNLDGKLVAQKATEEEQAEIPFG